MSNKRLFKLKYFPEMNTLIFIYLDVLIDLSELQLLVCYSKHMTPCQHNYLNLVFSLLYEVKLLTKMFSSDCI